MTLARQAKDALNWVLARAYFERACTLRHAAACHELAILTTDDMRAQVEAFQRACDMGELLACSSLAVMFELGSADKKTGLLRKDPKRAVHLVTKACEGGHACSCAQLADYIDRRLAGQPVAHRAHVHAALRQSADGA